MAEPPQARNAVRKWAANPPKSTDARNPGRETNTTSPIPKAGIHEGGQWEIISSRVTMRKPQWLLRRPLDSWRADEFAPNDKQELVSDLQASPQRPGALKRADRQRILTARVGRAPSNNGGRPIQRHHRLCAMEKRAITATWPIWKGKQNQPRRRGCQCDVVMKYRLATAAEKQKIQIAAADGGTGIWNH